MIDANPNPVKFRLNKIGSTTITWDAVNAENANVFYTINNGNSYFI